MKLKPSAAMSLTNKKTTPPTVGKIGKPKRFRGKSKTLSSKLTSAPNTPKNTKIELSARKSSNNKNRKISPELNLGLKIEKILENGGPNVIKLGSESETPKRSIVKKKKVKKEESLTQTFEKKKVKRTKSANTEVSNENKIPLPKPKKKAKNTDKAENHEIHPEEENQQGDLDNQQGKKKKVKLIRRKNLSHLSKHKIETETSSSDAASQSNQETDKDSKEVFKENYVYSWGTPSHFNLELDKILNAVNALKQQTKQNFEKRQKSELFNSNTELICLQVAVIKKATCAKRMLRFTLPHSLVHDLSDVCLIVNNIKGHRKDNEGTIEYYKELFEKNNINEIKEIITARMLKGEYLQFEMKRKLRDRFDIFLADSRISHFLVKELGKYFAYTTKHPIPVRLSEGDVKENVLKALRKTQMKISPDSDMFSAVVGHMGQSSEEIAANVHAVAEGLAEQLPGNWPNVRALYLITSGFGKSFPLPVYISLLSPNSVPVPVMEPQKKKGDVIVEDELSTMLDARVRVMPDGTVHVLKDKTRSSSVSDAEDEEILAMAEKRKKEAKSSRLEDLEQAKPKSKSEKIVQEAEEKFVKLYKGNLDDIDIDEDNNDDSGNEDNDSIGDENLAGDENLGCDEDDNDNVENDIDNNVDSETTNKSKKRKPAAHSVEVKKAKKLKKPKQLTPEDKDDGDDNDDESEHKVKRKKPKDERVAKTNWIKSAKKAGSKKLSKSQRKAKIKTKNLKK